MNTHPHYLQPVEHLQIIPVLMRPLAYRLLNRLPTLLGDNIHDSLQEVSSRDTLSHEIKHLCQWSHTIIPQYITNTQPATDFITHSRGKKECSKKSKDKIPMITLALASQSSFIPPKGRRIKHTLKEAVQYIQHQFQHSSHMQLAFLVSDYWDQKFMQTVYESFQQFLADDKVIVPVLHHGALLTPICYL